MKRYNREKAALYAQKWALGSNPDFYHFSGIGGDCTNFISQCLLAGESVMNYDQFYGWFYINSYNRSPSWTSVEYLNRFLLGRGRVGPVAKIVSIEKLEIGDLIQLRQNPFRFNHSVIITKIENGEIYVCAHTDDSLNRPLSTYSYLEAVGLHIEGIEV